MYEITFWKNFKQFKLKETKGKKKHCIDFLEKYISLYLSCIYSSIYFPYKEICIRNWLHMIMEDVEFHVLLSTNWRLREAECSSVWVWRSENQEHQYAGPSLKQRRKHVPAYQLGKTGSSHTLLSSNHWMMLTHSHWEGFAQSLIYMLISSRNTHKYLDIPLPSQIDT